MQTLYEALSYQIPTSKNCQPFKTQLCELLLTEHKIQIYTYTMKPRSFQWTFFKLHATELKQLTQTQTHLLHDLNTHSDPLRNMKTTIFHNNEHTNIIISKLDITLGYRKNLKHIHTIITLQYLSSRKNNKVTNTTTYDIH